MQEEDGTQEAKEEPLSFEQRFQEGIYNACVQEAPKLKEKIDMAITMQLVRMRYEEMIKENPGMIPPTLPSVTCGACLKKKSLRVMHKCSRCMRIFYCSVECQRMDWPIHKQTCIVEIS